MLRTMPPGALGGDDRLLQFERIPFGDRGAHRRLVFGAAEHAERGGAMVGEIGVDITEVPVLGRIHTHHRIALVRDFCLFHLEVMAAAQRRGRAAGVDRDALLLAAAQFPEVADRQPDRTETGCAGLTYLERGRQDRVQPAGNFDRAGALRIETGGGQDRAQSVMRHDAYPSSVVSALASAARSCR